MALVLDQMNVKQYHKLNHEFVLHRCFGQGPAASEQRSNWVKVRCAYAFEFCSAAKCPKFKLTPNAKGTATASLSCGKGSALMIEEFPTILPDGQVIDTNRKG
jgi:hypothetical protein